MARSPAPRSPPRSATPRSASTCAAPAARAARSRFFETLQSTDGYDAVEIIAAQPWVLNHQIGMVGLSYPGITSCSSRSCSAAVAGVDRAAVGHRRHRTRHALPGRHPEQRLRDRLGRRAQATRSRAASRGREAPSTPVDQTRIDTTPARCNPRHHPDDRGEQLLSPRARRLGDAGDLRAQHRRAGVPRGRVAGRADGSLPRPCSIASPAPATSTSP